MTLLKHLIVMPRGGLCNRLLAISSAKRICTIFGSRCTVVWEWGNFHQLFKVDDSLEWIPNLSKAIERDSHKVLHLHSTKGGSPENRRVHLSFYGKVIVQSNYAFNAFEEPKLISEKELKNYLPMPSETIIAKVNEFKKIYFCNTVGVHIRRTDHKPATAGAPDELYYKEIEQVIADGNNIFLATDNQTTSDLVKKRFKDKVIIYPKNSNLKRRWPRKFQMNETVDDLIDLQLLAQCKYIIGAVYSSYSRVAMLYNGSPRNKALKTFEPNLAAL